MNWSAQVSAGGHQGLVYEESTGKDVALTYDVQHMNIVAACPDLLAALVLCVENYENNGGLLKEGTPSHIMHARAAIDKARNG